MMKRLHHSGLHALILISLCMMLAWLYMSRNPSFYDDNIRPHIPTTGSLSHTLSSENTQTAVPEHDGIEKSHLTVDHDSWEKAHPNDLDKGNVKHTVGASSVEIIAAPSTSSSTSFEPSETTNSPTVDETEETKEMNDEHMLTAPAFVQAILRPEDTSKPRLKCPAITTNRYDYLKGTVNSARSSEETLTSTATAQTIKPRYLFALDLYEIVDLLPTLMGSILQAIKWLGPENCVVSIVEGRSADGTYEVLSLLTTHLHSLGTPYHLQTSSINPSADGGDRIGSLASLRNLALQPLTSNPTAFSSSPLPTIIFINDVALCPDDILELLHQHQSQNMSMTCAMDWHDHGKTFYDVWVSRTLNGDIFFEIPQSSSWEFARNLFWNDPRTKSRFESKLPFQVFACWNGISVLDSTPFLPYSSSPSPQEEDSKTKQDQSPLQFRRNDDKNGECFMGEPTLLCKDLWRRNLSRIAVVPSVNVGYNVQEGQETKDRQGYVGENVRKAEKAIADNNKKKKEDKEREGERGREDVPWTTTPPGVVKCSYNLFSDVSWVPALWP